MRFLIGKPLGISGTQKASMRTPKAAQVRSQSEMLPQGWCFMVRGSVLDWLDTALGQSSPC
jgi:hypothetical protein